MKTRLLLLILCIYTSVNAQYPVNGLNAAYEFNGNLNDIANGNNMSIVSGFMLYPANRVSTPGSSLNLIFGNAKRTDVPYPNSGTSRDIMTYSFWVNTSLTDANRRVIIEDSNRTDDADADFDGSYIYMKNGKIGIQTTMRFNGNDLRKETKEMANIISDGEWHHVYVNTYWRPFGNSVTQRFISMAIDGGTISTTMYSYARQSAQIFASYDQVGDVAIGNNRAGDMTIANRYTNGLDDLLIYNRVLDANDIAAITSDMNFCFVPNANLISATNIQNNSADINIGDSETYDVAYVPVGTPFNQATIINNVTNATSLAGLDSNITYEVYIRRLCGNTTSWSLPITFRTTRTLGILYVNQAATGLGSGISWSNAYTTLNEALADATDGEEVWIAGGTYKPSTTGNRSASFTINNFVSIYGGFLGNESTIEDRVYGANETILSGDLNGDDDSIITVANTLRADNSYKVINITITSNTTASAVELDRLTITGGNASATSGVNRYGAAISKDNAVRNLYITDCVLNNNSGRFGTVYSSFGSGGIGNLIIKRSIIDSNYGRLGTLYGTSATSTSFNVKIENTQITNNVATDTNGSDGAAGSAMFFKSAVNSSVAIRIENSTFVKNQDLGTASGYNNFNRSIIIAQRSAGPSVNSGATVRVYNSILYDNTTSGSLTSKAISRGNATTPEPTVEIFNSIDKDNFSNVPVANVVNSSNANPLFVDATNNDFKLQTNSPALDAGDNSFVTNTEDLNKNSRIFNTTVDMGAYEYFTSLLMAPKVFLQGPMLSSSTTLMDDDLRVANYIPTTSPYPDLATCNSSVFAITGNNAIVDWVLVELRDATINTTIVASQSGLIQRDGDIVAVDGTSPLLFNVPNGNYYTVIKHRNHLGIMTLNAIVLGQSVTTIDFTNVSTPITFGTNAQTTFGMPSGLLGMWAGDANGDGRLNYLGALSDVPSIRSQVFNDPANSIFGGPAVATYGSLGYYSTDINMDGVTYYSGAASDVLFIRNNIFNNPSNSVFGGPAVATYVFTQQLPEGAN